MNRLELLTNNGFEYFLDSALESIQIVNPLNFQEYNVGDTAFIIGYKSTVYFLNKSRKVIHRINFPIVDMYYLNYYKGILAVCGMEQQHYGKAMFYDVKNNRTIKSYISDKNDTYFNLFLNNQFLSRNTDFYRINTDFSISLLFTLPSETIFINALNDRLIYYLGGNLYHKHINDGHISIQKKIDLKVMIPRIAKILDNNKMWFYDMEKLDTLGCHFTSNTINAYVYDSIMKCIYTSENTSIKRLNLTLKKFPKLFNNSFSTKIFDIKQNKNGNILLSSYNGFLALIQGKELISKQYTGKQFMNGAFTIDNDFFVSMESYNGIQKLNSDMSLSPVMKGSYIFSSQVMDDKVLLGTLREGLKVVDKNSLYKLPIKLKTFDEKNGNFLSSITYILKDKNKNIWFSGNDGKEINIYWYNIYTDEYVRIISAQNNFSKVNVRFVCKDNLLWLANTNGKLYYHQVKPRYSKFDSLSYKEVKHPLLNKTIFSVNQYDKYMLIGQADRILLLDKDLLLRKDSVVIRYMHPYECGFTTPLDFYNLTKDNRDSTYWMATEDMLYQWNIKEWLTIPTFKCNPTINLEKGKEIIKLKNQSITSLPPDNNSIALHIKYQTRDNLPRYKCIRLYYEGKLMNEASYSFQNDYNFTNLKAGTYELYLSLLNTDGTILKNKYTIIIEEYFFKKWTVWLLISSLFLGLIVWLYSNKLAHTRQEKKIKNLQLKTLSSFYKPHIIKNALNSIGTDLGDKPHAQKLIDYLGQNISILHDHAKTNQLLIPITDEWKLCLNTINIFKNIYFKNLELNIYNENLIYEHNSLKVPNGLIQLFVENAFQHGLRRLSKHTVPKLNISLSDAEKALIIALSDNGAGLPTNDINEIAKTEGSIKNLLEIINILNFEKKNYTISIGEDEQHRFNIIIIKINKKINIDGNIL